MTLFNTCKLKITFKFGKCNDRLMNLTVNDEVLNPVDNYVLFEKNIQLPEKLSIKTSGKIDGKDTKVDTDGNIVEDMYIQIENISLDDFPLNEIYLHQRINLLTEKGETNTSNYIGFNGTVNLDFVEENVFAQVLTLNN